MKSVGDTNANGDLMALGAPADLRNNIFFDAPSATAAQEYFADQAVSCTNNLFFNNAGVYVDGALGARDVAVIQ